MTHKIVPDYIIYDELKKQRDRATQEQRPQLEVPRYIPLWPEGEFGEKPREDEVEHDTDRGEVVIQMW